MRTMRVATCLLVWGIGVGGARADEPDADVIARVTGLQAEVRNGVVKVSLPRTDLTVTVDGVRMKPFQGHPFQGEPPRATASLGWGGGGWGGMRWWSGSSSGVR